MIHDATGKFSSRWPSPDRHSLALVISLRLAMSGLLMHRTCRHACGTYMPHIGETAGKTNAIRRHEQAPATPGKWAVTGFDRYLGLLLPVVGQNLVAGLGQLGTVLLKAVQNDEVAVIHHRATVFLHVVGTGLLLLGRSA